MRSYRQARGWRRRARRTSCAPTHPPLARSHRSTGQSTARPTCTSPHGWKDVEPSLKLRNLLEPDTGGAYWNVPSADCYVGLAPRWYVDVWSYHYVEQALMHESALYPLDTQALVVSPAFATLARAYGVTHVLTRYPADEPALTLVAREPNAYVYRVEGCRARPRRPRRPADADRGQRARAPA